MDFNKDKDERELLGKLVKLTPEQFLGLAKLLGVKLSWFDSETKEGGMKDAEQILEEIVAEFRKLKHKDRKVILKAV